MTGDTKSFKSRMYRCTHCHYTFDFPGIPVVCVNCAKAGGLVVEEPAENKEQPGTTAMFKEPVVETPIQEEVKKKDGGKRKYVRRQPVEARKKKSK